MTVATQPVGCGDHSREPAAARIGECRLPGAAVGRDATPWSLRRGIASPRPIATRASRPGRPPAAPRRSRPCRTRRRDRSPRRSAPRRPAIGSSIQLPSEAASCLGVALVPRATSTIAHRSQRVDVRLEQVGWLVRLPASGRSAEIRTVGVTPGLPAAKGSMAIATNPGPARGEVREDPAGDCSSVCRTSSCPSAEYQSSPPPSTR